MLFNFYWYSRLLYYVLCLLLVKTVLEFLFYFNKYSNYRNEQLAKQNKIIAQKLEHKKKENKAEYITLQLEKENLEINRDKLILIQSTGNYLEIYLREQEGNTKKLVKRGKMHQAEKDLEGFVEFFRCHRAFIVNLKYVNEVKGNCKNARLVFSVKINETPVSRNQFKLLKEKLESLSVS